MSDIQEVSPFFKIEPNIQDRFTHAEKAIIDQAIAIIDESFKRENINFYDSPQKVMDYLKLNLATEDREVFSVMLLDTKNQLIKHLPLFYGTINAATVYTREIVKVALKYNAANIIMAHNHPSGISEPSDADRAITTKIVNALQLIDMRVIDHIIVGKTCFSFMERGLI